jgi:hypothetical protein
MNETSKKDKREAWDFAININQLDGEWIPSDEYKKLVEKEINGEITIDEMIEILDEKYINKDQKRKSWDFGLNINQLDGEYKPSDFLKELIEKDINGEMGKDEILKLLVEKYTEK